MLLWTFSAAAQSAAGGLPACTGLPGVERHFAPGRIVMIGEGHGTEEMPDAFARIVCSALQSGLPVAVGLELPPDQHPALNAYLDSDGGAAARRALLATSHWKDGRDGRASVAMFKLIEQLRVLRKSGHPLSVFCLYEHLKDGEFATRGDQVMAERIRKEHRARPQALLLTFTGNYHSTLALPRAWAGVKAPNGQPLPQPMGALLADLKPVSINLEPGGGTAWNCTQSGCGIKPEPEQPVLPASALWVLAEPGDKERFTAQVNVGRTTASIPATDAFKQ